MAKSPKLIVIKDINWHRALKGIQVFEHRGQYIVCGHFEIDNHEIRRILEKLAAKHPWLHICAKHPVTNDGSAIRDVGKGMRAVFVHVEDRDNPNPTLDKLSKLIRDLRPAPRPTFLEEGSAAQA